MTKREFGELFRAKFVEQENDVIQIIHGSHQQAAEWAFLLGLEVAAKLAVDEAWIGTDMKYPKGKYQTEVAGKIAAGIRTLIQEFKK